MGEREGESGRVGERESERVRGGEIEKDMNTSISGISVTVGSKVSG